MMRSSEALSELELCNHFLDLEQLINLGFENLLFAPARPGDFNFLDLLLSPQTKKDPMVICREITCRRAHHIVLDFSTFAGDLHFGPNRSTIAFDTAKLHRDPIISVTPLVPNEIRRPIAIGDDNINVTIIVEVAKGSSTAGPHLLEHCS